MAIKNHDVYNNILCECQSASEAIRHLFYATKAARPQFSLAYLSRKTGIKSRGYLSDLMRGKKQLKGETAMQLAQAFTLTADQERLFRLLVDLEKTDPKDPAYRSLSEALRISRKALKLQLAVASESLRDLLTNLEVYSFVSMHPDGVRFQTIKDYFKNTDAAQIEPALGDLIKTGLISQESGLYQSTGESFMFSDSEGGKSHLDFLRASFLRSLDELGYWFDRKDQSYVQASLITTNRLRYLEALPKLKRDLLDMQNDLDSNEADMILRFNVQITPAAPDD